MHISWRRLHRSRWRSGFGHSANPTLANPDLTSRVPCRRWENETGGLIVSPKSGRYHASWRSKGRRLPLRDVAATRSTHTSRAQPQVLTMDSPHNLDIIIVGAGLSGTTSTPPSAIDPAHITIGICALIRARQKLPRATVAVFEKGESVGGTWAKNTYPGLSCDIPSQVCSRLLMLAALTRERALTNNRH